MKKTVKNRDLSEVLINAAQLGGFAMPGDLTLAVVGARKKLKNAFDLYNETAKEIGSSRCEKDEQGNAITEFQRDETGKELVDHPRKLKFRSSDIEREALMELQKLDEQEVEFEVRDCQRTVIEGFKNITPMQLEAIATLVNIVEN